MGLTWAHSSRKRGRDGPGRQFGGRVIHLGTDKAEGEKQQMKTGGAGSNSKVAADSITFWVCGLTGSSRWFC